MPELLLESQVLINVLGGPYGTAQNICGAEGIRTPGLLIANETRYQLRHSPLRERRLSRAGVTVLRGADSG